MDEKSGPVHVRVENLSRRAMSQSCRQFGLTTDRTESRGFQYQSQTLHLWTRQRLDRLWLGGVDVAGMNPGAQETEAPKSEHISLPLPAGELKDDCALRFYHSLIESMHEGVVVHDHTGGIITYNQSALEILGLSAEQLLGRTSIDPCWRCINETGQPFPGETHPASITIQTGKPCHGVIMGVYRPNGALRWLSINSSVIAWREGRPASVLVTFADITERRTAERHWETLFRHSTDGMCLIPHDQSPIRINPAFQRISGLSEPVLTVAQFRSLFHPEETQRLLNIEQLLAEGRSIEQVELRLQHADGSWRWISWSCPAPNAQDPVQYALARDITARRHHEENLKVQATTDSLTGLYNRGAFLGRLDSMLSSPVEDSQSLALLFIDLDGFKLINDTLGHDAGDEVLRTCARRIRRAVRQQDICGRLGGDELTVLLVGRLSDESAVMVGEKLLEQIQQPILLSSGGVVSLSASIGVAMDFANGDRPMDLLRQADTAMYRAKRSGKSRVCLYRSGQKELVSEDSLHEEFGMQPISAYSI